MTKQEPGLASGDVLRTWYGDHIVLEIAPCCGPFAVMCGITRMPCADMTIDCNGLHEVLLPD